MGHNAGNMQLGSEDRAGYGDEDLADLTVQYLVSQENTSISNLYDLMVMKSEYEHDDRSFIDEKEKIILKLSLLHQFSEDFSVRVGIEGCLLEEGRDW